MRPISANKRLPALLASLIATAGLTQGCSQWRYELGESISEVQTPAVEESLSLGSVLEKLGPPMRVSATPDGYVLAWEHWRIKEDTVGLSLGPLGADFISFDWGKARMKGKFILATFNHNHQLTGSAFSTWDSEAGSGAALQPFIGVSVVDVGDLVRRMPHHRWGATSLDRLPATLNADYRPDTGQGGIQQRATPTGIGQQSLEMD
jgi:hypothetical protein